MFIYDKTIIAVETIDKELSKLIPKAIEAGFQIIITADHGNAEQMQDHTSHQAHTAHTLNPVPFLYIGRDSKLEDGGALRDIAPSMLAIMGVPQPVEMTGRSLIQLR
jgi:2,3-bisphosphoglycerate-independent phosphoglycerate mutase